MVVFSVMLSLVYPVSRGKIRIVTMGTKPEPGQAGLGLGPLTAVSLFGIAEGFQRFPED